MLEENEMSICFECALKKFFFFFFLSLVSIDSDGFESKKVQKKVNFNLRLHMGSSLSLCSERKPLSQLAILVSCVYVHTLCSWNGWPQPDLDKTVMMWSGYLGKIRFLHAYRTEVIFFFFWVFTVLTLLIFTVQKPLIFVLFFFFLIRNEAFIHRKKRGTSDRTRDKVSQV